MDLKERILAAEDRKRVAVVVPEWGGLTVYLYRVSGLERGAVEKKCFEWRQGKSDIRYWERFKSLCVCASLCQEEGAPINFTEDEFEQLASKSASAIERLFDASNELNRWVGAADLGKNSEASRNGSSGSGSPQPSAAAASGNGSE